MAKAKEAKTTKKAPEIANKTVAELKADLLIA